MAGKLHSASDGRPLPPGWIEAQDPQTLRWLYVDTTTNPPRSSWLHPLDDPDVASNQGREGWQGGLSLSVPAPFGQSSHQPQHPSQPFSPRPRPRSASPSEGPPIPAASSTNGYIQFFSKLRAKFSSPDSAADREWARAEREAARKQRELATRQRRQAVLLQRVRALEVERNAYHRAGVEFPHEELLAQARANALAAGVYSPSSGYNHRGDWRRTDEDLPPYTATDGRQGDPAANSRREEPGMSDSGVHAQNSNTRADIRAARQVGASAAGGAVIGALVGAFLS